MLQEIFEIYNKTDILRRWDAYALGREQHFQQSGGVEQNMR